jgi:DNA-directed RNA polymerase subunit omega
VGDKLSSLDRLARYGSRYTLVVAVARRARQLMESDATLTGTKPLKPVTSAMEEIAEGRVVFRRPRAGNR